MRVAWLVGGDLAQRTGGYVYDRLVIEGLRARGAEVDVASPGELENAQEKRKTARLDAVVGDALWVREIGPGFERTERSVARVLLVHHLTSWESERENDESMRAAEARAIAASDRLVVTSQATASRLAEAYPDRTIDVVAPGADRLRRHRRVVRGDGGVELLFVGSLIPRKRVLMLLDAVERVADSRLALTIVGDPLRDPEHARDLAARVDGSSVLRSCVSVMGSVDDDILARIMARADALVLPSSLEGYGIVVAEALHAGLAVLAARESAHAAAASSEAALTFEGVQGLTEAIHRFVGDPSRREAMKQAAGGFEPQRWRDAVGSFEEVLNRAVAAQAARALDPAPGP